jgi:hypothetical protein
MADSGVYRGTVVRVADGQVFVEVALLGVGKALGPCMCVGAFSVGDSVIVAVLGGNINDVAILNVMGVEPPTQGLIAFISATAAAPYVTALVDTFELVDSTHLTVTFTAPASGKVLVRISCSVVVSFGTGTLGIYDGIGIIAEYPLMNPLGYVTGNVSFPLLITGLTPNTSYTYKLVFKGEADPGNMSIDATVTPAVMEVWGA